MTWYSARLPSLGSRWSTTGSVSRARTATISTRMGKAATGLMWSQCGPTTGQEEVPDEDMYDKYADFCVVTGDGDVKKLYKDLIPKIEKIRAMAWPEQPTRGVERYTDVAMGNCRPGDGMTFRKRRNEAFGKETEKDTRSQDAYTRAIHKFKLAHLARKEAQKER